jgi:hypothetical protein
MRSALELVADPFNTCMGVIFRVGKEVIKVVTSVTLNLAISSSSLSGMEKFAYADFELMDAF